MEGSSSLRGVGGGRSAQFVVKTYEMVDDSATDEIVSWSDTNNSFIVWNPTEFARLLLPSYFSHNNFNSFIRQLNTYGFRKIHEDRWEFANEDFVKGQKHILRKIHRRKPYRSHSVSHSHNTTHPPPPPPPPPPQQVPTNNNVAVDPEKAALEEQIGKLSQEKATLESTISGFKQILSAAELHLEELQSRMDAVEKRQNNLVNLFQTALQNPSFVEQISRKIDSNMDHLLLGGHNNKKKKRLPDPPPPPPQDVIDPVAENGSVDNNNNNSSCSLIGMEMGNIFDEDYLNKLISLELSSSPAAISSDINNLISTSNDDGESPHDDMMVVLSESGEPKEEVPLGFALDNDETLTFDDMDYSCFESPKLQCYYSCTTSEGGGGDCNHLSCFLNQSLQQGSEYSPPIPSVPQMDIQESVESILLFHDDNDNEYYSSNIGGASSSSSNRNIDLANEVTTTTATGLASSVQEQEPSGGNNQGTLNAPAVSVLNDVFWEQFLTE